MVHAHVVPIAAIAVGCYLIVVALLSNGLGMGMLMGCMMRLLLLLMMILLLVHPRRFLGVLVLVGEHVVRVDHVELLRIFQVM